jgi:hypothetical protein
MSVYAYDLIFAIVVVEVLFAFSIGLICIVLSFNLFMALKDSSLSEQRHLLQVGPTGHRRDDLLPVGDFPVIESNSTRLFVMCTPGESKMLTHDRPSTEPLLGRDHDSYSSDEDEGQHPIFDTAVSMSPFHASATDSSEDLSLDDDVRGVAVEAAPKEDNNSFISVLQSFFQYVL